MGQAHAVQGGKGHRWRPGHVWGCAAQAFQDLAEDLPWAKHMQCEVARDTGGGQDTLVGLRCAGVPGPGGGPAVGQARAQQAG